MKKKVSSTKLSKKKIEENTSLKGEQGNACFKLIIRRLLHSPLQIQARRTYGEGGRKEGIDKGCKYRGAVCLTRGDFFFLSSTYKYIMRMIF